MVSLMTYVFNVCVNGSLDTKYRPTKGYASFKSLRWSAQLRFGANYNLDPCSIALSSKMLACVG